MSTQPKRIRIGILGGSFNPPHPGHLFISERSIKELSLTQLWWMVSPQNPLKETDIKASFQQRVELCKDITKDNPKIRIKDYEQRFFRSGKKFYTYNLLKRLNERFKDHEFYFIIGSDSLINFHEWYRYKEIPKLAKIIVYDRPDYKFKTQSSIAAKSISYRFIQGKTMAVSSTDIRKTHLKL